MFLYIRMYVSIYSVYISMHVLFIPYFEVHVHMHVTVYIH